MGGSTSSTAPRHRYGLAVATTLAGLLLLWILPFREGRGYGELLMVLAVLGSAWHGGRGPGLLATALVAGLTLQYDDVLRFDLAPWRILRHALFVVDGVMISLVIGALHAARVRAESESARARASDERFRRLSESGLIGVAVAERDGPVREANDEFLRVAGRTRAELESGAIDWAGLTAAEYRRQDERNARELEAAGFYVPHPTEFPRPDGARSAVLLGAARLEGTPPRSIAVVLDVSARRRAEAALWLLAEAGEVLGAPLDVDAMLGRVARLAVPVLGEVGLVYLSGPDGAARAAGQVLADPSLAGAADALGRPDPATADGLSPVERALRGATARMVPGPSASAQPGEAEALRAAGLASAILVPLAARGRTLGALAFGSTRPHDGEDLALAEELARRAALAVDNARLLAEAIEARDAAEAARARTGLILESITDGFFALDRQWRFTYINPRAEALLHHDRDALLGQVIWDVFSKAAGDAIRNHFHEAAAHGAAVGFEGFCPEVGAWLEMRAYPSADGLSVYFRDTTERRLAAEVLRSSEQRFRTLAEAIPQMVWVARPDGRLDYLNARWLEYTGVDPATLTDEAWSRVLHPDDLAPGRTRWRDGLPRGAPLEAIERIRRASDGAYRWHLTRAVPVRADDGALVAWFGTSTDIDARRRTEEGLSILAEASIVLSAARDDPEALAAAARLAVPALADWCLVDVAEPDGSVRRVESIHADPSTGTARAEAFPDTAAGPLGAARVVRTGRPELVSDLPDDGPDGLAGRLGLRSYLCVPLEARGRILGALTLLSAESRNRLGPADLELAGHLATRVGLAVDNARLLADAHRAQLEAERANRSKDRFLAALSHELRTPLTPVLVGVTALLEDPDLPEAVRPVLEVTRRNVALEARLIDDLLDVTRIAQGKLRLDRRPVDVHELIRQAVEICRDETAAAGLRLELSLEAETRHVDGDPARIQQVLWNLIKNAGKFTPSGGRIAVRSRNEPAPAGTNTDAEAGAGASPPRLVVEVADTGIGIDPEVLPQIFDAFEQGGSAMTAQFGGLGLGLAISRSLAEAHDGRLSASSPGRGQGATFRLELPTVPSPANGARARESAPRSPSDPSADRPPLRILLAEDNPDTLRVMARLLRQRGHRVSAADGVEEALRLAGAEGPFDLLISDIGLPDGSGLELLRRLRAQGAPPARSIALSGFGTQDDIRRSLEAGFIAHLTKPVDFPTLETAIRAAVGQAG